MYTLPYETVLEADMPDLVHHNLNGVPIEENRHIWDPNQAQPQEQLELK
jgi:hypothetical protein|tara:strand:- start:70 stop:216 length:147 start_codon:yes stop_codon:yes gene_type:complete